MADDRNPAQFHVRNWSQFQHYKDRSPAWIKLHFELLSSEDWVSLDDASRLLAIVCMLLASRNGGYVPNRPAYVKRVAYLDADPDFGPLISCGFLEIPLSDASDPQASASEEQASARLEERRGEEIREEERSAAAPADMAFVGRVIRLNVADFDRWRKAYPNISDMTAELTKADDYYAEHPPKDGKWFFPVSKWLDRANKGASKPDGPTDEETYPPEIYGSLR